MAREVEDSSPSDEINIAEIFQWIGANWRLLSAGAIVGGGLAAGVAAYLPAKYEALAYVQVGQVGQVGQVSSVPVETAHQAIERIGSGAFLLEVSQQIGDKAWQEQLVRSGSAGSSRFKVSVVKNSGSVELKAQGKSPAEAERLAAAIVSTLSKRHAVLAEPTISRLKHELSVVQEKRKAFEASYKELGSVLASARLSDQRFTQYSLATSMRQNRENELYSLKQQELALQTALSAPASQPARAVEPIFVPENPVSPKVPLITLLGILVGGMLGAGVAFFRQRKSQG